MNESNLMPHLLIQKGSVMQFRSYVRTSELAIFFIGAKVEVAGVIGLIESMVAEETPVGSGECPIRFTVLVL